MLNERLASHYGIPGVEGMAIRPVDLPAGIKPGLSPWSPTGEIVRYVLEGPGYTTNQLKAVQDWVLNPLLKQVPGVIDVTGYGGTVKQYQVLINARLLRQYNVTLQQVEEAITRSNANVGGDLLTLGTQSHVVRAIGLLGGGKDSLDPANVENALLIEVEKLQDIQDVVVAVTNGIPIFVRQIAKVEIKHRPRLGVDEQARREGQDQVAVRHPTVEERVGSGSSFVHVRVERVAGELGEMLDVGERHLARAGHHRIADTQIGQRLAERVHAIVVSLRAGDPAAADRGQHVR
jgi:Cu/Ag efflux pump CusA